ncbi:hypothetical protein OAH36_01480 [Verrucomicrobia bacterium]|nr:hypothetical protein [Verrucomicrobiota bacterium]MDB4798251.1 hypothetical protein [Verrucomicrobiota bacterium]
MLRNVMGFIVGFLVAGTLVGIIERMGHVAYPPPPGMDPSDTESIKAFMSQIPLGGLMYILVAWVAGTLAGSFAATRIARDSPRASATAVGAMMLFTSVYMMVTIPVPTWFWAAALIGVPLATAVPIMKATVKSTGEDRKTLPDSE